MQLCYINIAIVLCKKLLYNTTYYIRKYDIYVLRYFNDALRIPCEIH